MITSSATTPKVQSSWQQKASNAEIRLYPDDLRIVKSRKAIHPVPRLNPDVLQEALHRFQDTYFVGFTNVDNAIRGVSKEKPEPKIVGMSARDLQHKTTWQLGKKLREEKEELVHLEPGKYLIPIAHVCWQNQDIQPHADWSNNTVKSIGYMSLGAGIKNNGELSFWNIRDSKYIDDLGQILEGRYMYLAKSKMHEIESVTPIQDPNERPFFVCLDGGRVLLHSISGIELDDDEALRLIQIVELRQYEPGSDFPFPKRREGSITEQTIAERDEFILGNDYDAI